LGFLKYLIANGMIHNANANVGTTVKPTSPNVTVASDTPSTYGSIVQKMVHFAKGLRREQVLRRLDEAYLKQGMEQPDALARLRESLQPKSGLRTTGHSRY
jgi:hypothetical protein